MTKFAVVRVLLVAAWIGTAVADPCADAVINKSSGNYKNPESGSGLFGPWHCMSYYHCQYDAVTGTAKATEKHCWIVLPLRQYDPITRECQWFWRAKCDAANPSPTPAPTSTPITTAPTTAASTTTTAPTTASTTTTAPKTNT